jgi:hypothetical protein
MLRNTVIILALLIGCKDAHKDAHKDQISVKELPLLLQRYANAPEPGKMVAFPHVPLFKAPGDADARNLLSNPGFEDGQSPWQASGSHESVCAKTDLLCAEGRFSFQVLPPAAESVFVSQVKTIKPERSDGTLKPRTFYLFTALLFVPGASEVALEVRDMDENTLLRSEAVPASTSAWSRASLTFVTGNRKQDIAIGVRCSDTSGNNPILIDQCALYAFPATENFIPSGTMETVPEADKMPEWYVGSKSASPVEEGYQSKYAIELPPLSDRVSSLVCLIPARQQLEGRSVWFSAMIKSVPEGNAPAPDVTLVLRLEGVDGKRSETSTTCRGSGEWTEATLLAKMPEHVSADATDVPPFHTLLFKRPAGINGRVFIDEVVMLAIPEGDFAGGLAPPPESR